MTKQGKEEKKKKAQKRKSHITNIKEDGQNDTLPRCAYIHRGKEGGKVSENRGYNIDLGENLVINSPAAIGRLYKKTKKFCLYPKNNFFLSSPLSRNSTEHNAWPRRERKKEEAEVFPKHNPYPHPLSLKVLISSPILTSPRSPYIQNQPGPGTRAAQVE